MISLADAFHRFLNLDVEKQHAICLDLGETPPANQSDMLFDFLIPIARQGLVGELVESMDSRTKTRRMK